MNFVSVSSKSFAHDCGFLFFPENDGFEFAIAFLHTEDHFASVDFIGKNNCHRIDDDFSIKIKTKSTNYFKKSAPKTFSLNFEWNFPIVFASVGK